MLSHQKSTGVLCPKIEILIRKKTTFSYEKMLMILTAWYTHNLYHAQGGKRYAGTSKDLGKIKNPVLVTSQDFFNQSGEIIG